MTWVVNRSKLKSKKSFFWDTLLHINQFALPGTVQIQTILICFSFLSFEVTDLRGMQACFGQKSKMTHDIKLIFSCCSHFVWTALWKNGDHRRALPMHRRQNAQNILAELYPVFICIEWPPPLSQSVIDLLNLRIRPCPASHVCFNRMNSQFSNPDLKFKEFAQMKPISSSHQTPSKNRL